MTIIKIIPIYGVLYLLWTFFKFLCNIPSLLIENNILAPAHAAPKVQEKKDNEAVKIKSVPKPLEINLLDRSVSGSFEDDNA